MGDVQEFCKTWAAKDWSNDAPTTTTYQCFRGRRHEKWLPAGDVAQVHNEGVAGGGGNAVHSRCIHGYPVVARTEQGLNAQEGAGADGPAVARHRVYENLQKH